MTVTRQQLLDAIAAYRDATWDVAAAPSKAVFDAAAYAALLRQSDDAYRCVLDLVYAAVPA